MGERFWVFAYASLMWQPDFEPEKTLKARLRGYHRAMCILSIRYRGTEQNPGLVMGLDRGGSCLGLIHLVKAGEEKRVRDMLDARELPTGVYDPRFLETEAEDGERIPALAYVARREHVQYRKLEIDEAAKLVRQGTGASGRAYDYLRETLDSMRKLGIKDAKLERLLKLAE